MLTSNSTHGVRRELAVFWSYTNGKDDLYHCRRLRLLIDLPCGGATDAETPHYEVCPESTCTYHEWEEETSYNGWPVPPKLLRSLYALVDDTARWTKPGRGLKLPAEAWEMLDEWRDTLGDPWHLTPDGQAALLADEEADEDFSDDENSEFDRSDDEDFGDDFHFLGYWDDYAEEDLASDTDSS